MVLSERGVPVHLDWAVVCLGFLFGVSKMTHPKGLRPKVPDAHQFSDEFGIQPYSGWHSINCA